MSGAAGDAEDAGWQRLDKWLWCARFLKARAACARLVAEGRVRLNRQVTDKPHAKLRVGDVLTLPMPGGRVRVVRIRALATRRGPATEARLLFEEVAEAGGWDGGDGAPVPCAPAQSPAYPAAEHRGACAHGTDSTQGLAGSTR